MDAKAQMRRIMDEKTAPPPGSITLGNIEFQLPWEVMEFINRIAKDDTNLRAKCRLYREGLEKIQNTTGMYAMAQDLQLIARCVCIEADTNFGKSKP